MRLPHLQEKGQLVSVWKDQLLGASITVTVPASFCFCYEALILSELVLLIFFFFNNFYSLGKISFCDKENVLTVNYVQKKV